RPLELRAARDGARGDEAHRPARAFEHGDAEDRRMKRLVALAALALAVGCTAPPVGIGVNVETASRRGRGVIIGPHTVLTVCHVVQGSDEVEVDGMKAHVVSRHNRSTETGEDGIAVVELDKGEFPPERIGTVTEKVGAGVSYLPARGETPWPWGL